MARDRDNLLRGQGLLRQGITGASNRWKYYFKLTVCVAAMGAIGWPTYRAEPDQITNFFQYQTARVVHCVMQGAASDPEMTIWHDGRRYLNPVSVVASDPYYIRRADELERDAILGGIIGTFLGGLACIGFARLMRERGKTTVLRQMLDGIEARGESALVYDTSGEFIAHYYRPERGDVILNPFGAHSAYWSPFAEIVHPADAA